MTPARVILGWVGRILMVGAPLLIVVGLTYPDRVTFLEPVLCESRTSLGVDRGDPTTPLDNRSICSSDVRLMDVTERLVFLGLAALAGGSCAFLLRAKLAPPRMSAPRTPATH